MKYLEQLKLKFWSDVFVAVAVVVKQRRRQRERHLKI